RSDYVSVHTLLNAETRHLIGEAFFRRMKPTAILINTSRGPVVDEKALARALQEKRLAGAALDVWEQEPVAPDNPLLKMDNVIATSHAAYFSSPAVAQVPRSTPHGTWRSEEHTSELQSLTHVGCRLLLGKIHYTSYVQI